MKKIWKLLIISAYLLTPLILAFAIFSVNPQKYSVLNNAVPMVFGAVSYTWLLWQFVLSARPKFIERHFGLDKMYQFHGMIAIGVLIIAFLHKTINEFVYGENLMTQFGSIALTIFIGISALAFVFMSPGLLKKFKYAKLAIIQLEKILAQIKVITYERLKIMHNLTLIAMILMQVHVLMTSSARRSLLVFNLYMLYFLVAGGAYLYHKVFKPWILEDKRFVITETIQETADMWTIKFAPKATETATKAIAYLPGQFGYFSFASTALPMEEHPFSISSSPLRPDYMSVTVKALGDFTRKIGNLRVGDEVKMDGPYGDFSYLHHPKEQGVALIAGGVGITPVLSMLRHMDAMHEKRPVVLIWGVRTQGDLMAFQEIKGFESTMANFSCIPVVSNDPTWTGEKGYIDSDCLTKLLLKANLLNKTTGFYICGPPVLMDQTVEHLEALAMPSSHVHFEKFSM